jgi:chromate transporter
VRPGTSHGTSAALVFFSFLRLGLTAFGGPAMIPYIRDLAVRRRGWLDEETFNDGLVLAQSLPGATAMQCVAYVGLRVRGVWGAVLAYLAFGLPAFVLLLGLSVTYAATRDAAGVVTLLGGLQVIVVAIVAAATLSFGRAALTDWRSGVLAAAALGAYAVGVHPVAVVLGAGGMGALWLRRPLPSRMSHVVTRAGLTTRAVLLVVGLVVVGLLALRLTNAGIFDLGVLMLGTNLLAFGGGFAALPVLLHEIVGVHGWMSQRTFMDGIALGQVTPGPILMTATFIGYQLFGVAGAVVATVAMFTPSLVLVIAVAPYIDRFASSTLYAGVAQAVRAGFVGLLCYVTGTFAAGVQWDVPRLVLAAAAFVALARGIDVLYVVLAGGVISLVVR